MAGDVSVGQDEKADRSATRPVGAAPRTGGPSRPAFRPEVQGLRAVAILMVVVYHVWIGRVSGGVDSFLLISAFFLTGSFVRRMERGVRPAVHRYWLRAFRRLVPPAAITILATLALTLWFLRPTRWRDVLTEAVASLLYYQNWHLATSAVDYYASDRSVASPLQHFWSLSIQGQVFLLWPALFAVIWWLSRRTRVTPRRAAWFVFGAITALSFAYSVHRTSVSQDAAYFDTFARLWEFSLGSLLALALPLLERTSRVGRHGARQAAGFRSGRVITGWIGLALLVSCGALVDVEGRFPGWVALWPTVATCLVIAAGSTGSRWGADRFLSTSVMRWFGDLSYALYLVHWPLLIVAAAVLERPPGIAAGTVVIAVSVFLAWVLTRFVDSPIRYSSWAETARRRSLLIIATAMVPVVAATSVVGHELDQRDDRASRTGAATHPGAEMLAAGETERESGVPAPVTPIPLPTDLEDQWVYLPHPCAGRFAVSEPALDERCRQLTPDLPEESPTIAVIGSSHMQQHVAAIIPLAEEHGWNLLSVWKGGCTYGGNLEEPECREFNDHVQGFLLTTRPDVVVTAATSIPEGTRREIVPARFVRYAGELRTAGIEVVAYRDHPRFEFDMYECAQTDNADPARCERDVSGQFDDALVDDELAAPRAVDDAEGGFTYWDPNPYICPDELCRPVIGHRYVFLDDDHLTRAYVESMERFVEPVLTEVLS